MLVVVGRLRGCQKLSPVWMVVFESPVAPANLVLKIEDMRDGIPKSDKSDGTGTVDEAGKGDSEPEFSLWAAVEALATTASGSYSGFAGGRR